MSPEESGVVDGQPVNIPVLPLIRFKLGHDDIWKI